MLSIRRYLIPFVAGLLAGPAVFAADLPVAIYATKIRPLLAVRCFSCHGGLEQKSGLRLDTVALMTQGGDSGAAVAKGDPAKSLLLARVSDPDPATRMPPEGEGEPLSAEEVGLLRDWIVAGCPAPADEKPEADPRDHWAFQPRVRPAVPPTGNMAGIRNPIDAFLAAAREKAGVTPQPEAPRHVLVRRLFVDLIGLPPQPEELAAIEADTAPDWYERLVDRLLADPRHGERWARHWMDVWRYSDWWGLGTELRNSARHIWRFRDWIVESLNADAGYDEMLRLMLAADELHPDDPAKLRATGFLARNWNVFSRVVWLDETVEHVGKGLLGLTLNCSKCHAHKYDPVSQEDYYRMRAFFEPYHVRLDVVPGEGDLEKDGLPRVFDGKPDAPTYLFVRGNEAAPDTSRPILPGVPAVLAFREIDVRPVPLPPVTFEPERQPWVFDAHVATARRGVEGAEKALAQARAREEAARLALVAAERAALPQPSQPSSSPVAEGGFVDEFAVLDDGRWKLFGGAWRHEPGRLVQERNGQSRAAARLLPSPPRDFDVTVTFTITGGTTYRSIGLSFDASQADPATPPGPEDAETMVYASGWAAGPKVQAAFVSRGAWQYPPAATTPRPVESNRRHTLRVAVRDTLVNAWLDGEPVIAWRSPVPRRPGGLQFTTFDATAIFERFALAPLAESVVLREPAAAAGPPPASPDAARLALSAAEQEASVAAGKLAVATCALESVVRRAEATRIAWQAEHESAAPDIAGRKTEAALAAVRAEREVAVVQARLKLTEAEGALASAPADKKAAAEKTVAAAREGVEKAVKAAAEPAEKFAPLVGGQWQQTKFNRAQNDPAVPFQRTSTGRRRALAEWITDARNPLTARVAVNHIWLRHMGRPLVTTVFDFGRKGNTPAHPELLDWLASELVAGPDVGQAAGPDATAQAGGSEAGARGWRMKHLHRLIVTSAAYRMTSSSAGAVAAASADPDNRLLWRRDAIRLDAEVIRDALLTLAGTLDPAVGGPPVPASARDGSTRRSLYLHHSGVDRSAFLATFDAADAVACYQRDQSIVPQQALALSNAPFAQDAAATIAARVSRELPAGAADDAFVERAFPTVLGRGPDGFEREECLRVITALRALPDGKGAPGGPDPVRAQIVAALLNHNDFVTLR